MSQLTHMQTWPSPNTVVIGKRGEIHARLVTTTVKDFIFEGSDFSSVITGSLMASTRLIIIYFLVADIPRGARCARAQTPGGEYCAAYPTGEEHFTGRGESKKSEACSGEKSQDHGTDVCLTESIHQGKCWITGINGNWKVYFESIVHLDGFLEPFTDLVVLGKRCRIRAHTSGQVKEKCDHSLFF